MDHFSCVVFRASNHHARFDHQLILMEMGSPGAWNVLVVYYSKQVELESNETNWVFLHWILLLGAPSQLAGFFLLQNLRMMIFPKLTSDATFLDEPKSRTSVNPSLPLYHHSWYIDPTDIPRPKFIVGPDPFIARHPRDPKGGTSMQELLQVLHRTVKINTSKNLRFFRI